LQLTLNQNQNKTMKKSLKNKGKELEPMGYTASPPWKVKNKEAAWRKGYSSGMQDGFAEAKKSFEEERKKLMSDDDKNKALNDALKSLATITDATAHAISAVKGRL
jgi:hypothetical protein